MRSPVQLLTILLFSGIGIQSLAQTIEIRRTSQAIRVDGMPDESVWHTADSAYNFTQNFPTDTLPAQGQTTVKIVYDDDNIYVLGIMHNLPESRNYITPSLRPRFSWRC